MMKEVTLSPSPRLVKSNPFQSILKVIFFRCWWSPDEGEASRPSSFLSNGRIMQPSNKLPTMTTGTFILPMKRKDAGKWNKLTRKLVTDRVWSWGQSYFVRCCRDIWRSDKKPLGGQTPNPPSCHPSILVSLILVHHKLQQHRLIFGSGQGLMIFYYFSKNLKNIKMVNN